MLEVEIKAALGDKTPALIEGIAERNGFVRAEMLREIDVYFNGNDRNFMKTDEALRLRSCEKLGENTGETLITYKGPKMDTVSNTRTEYETQVGDLETMRNLLVSLGYQAAFTVEKTRQEWKLSVADGAVATLCLDTVKNLGSYLELETLVETEEEKETAVERLLALLDSFGVSRENLTRKSYLELLYF